MPLIFGCIAPHGSVIPGSAEAEKSPKTTAAMRQLGERMRAAEPDTVVVVTPHGVRVDGAVAISYSERVAGDLTEPAAGGSHDSQIHVEFDVDRDFARTLGEKAPAAGVPVAMIHYGATSGPHDLYPLDWGGLVPLWFMGEQFERKPRVVVLVPSRHLSLEQLAAFGRVIADAAAETESRVALIASSDLSHAHQQDGPYGYHPAAAQLDAWIEESVKTGDLARMLHPDMDLVGKAFPDGLWQIAFLTGATQRVPMSGEFLSYEVPTYYGMLCAAFTPAAQAAS